MSQAAECDVTASLPSTESPRCCSLKSRVCGLSSQAILCRYNEESQKHAALSLSKEHNPTQYEERMRIQKAGGNVRYQGIWESRDSGQMCIVRSILRSGSAHG